SGAWLVSAPWLPYAPRAALYAASDLLVSIAAEGLETELAYRTRLLDAAWGGLPSVAVGGGSLARELVAAGAAIESGGAPGEIARSVAALLSDAAARASASAAARRFAAGRTWAAVAGPRGARGAEARAAPGRLRLPAPEKDPGASVGSRLRRLFQ